MMKLIDKITSKRTKVYDGLCQILCAMWWQRKERERELEGKEVNVIGTYRGRNEVGRKASQWIRKRKKVIDFI